jgi:hypothetical protein
MGEKVECDGVSPSAAAAAAKAAARIDRFMCGSNQCTSYRDEEVLFVFSLFAFSCFHLRTGNALPGARYEPG